MDQLHEELKEPMTAELRDSDASDTDDKREGDRSPSEDEFLSCDSSSDRGEGDGQSKVGSAEAELLIQEEAGGRSISEKERMKERKFSCHQRRSNSEQVDEDADIDTSVMAVEGGASPEGLLPPPPRPASPARTPGMVHVRHPSLPPFSIFQTFLPFLIYLLFSLFPCFFLPPSSILIPFFSIPLSLSSSLPPSPHPPSFIM